MVTHQEMIRLQATQHDLISHDKIRTKEEYINHLMHRFGYEQAAKICINKTVLDLGCNTGLGTSMISKSCKRITGADVSSRAIASARRQYREENLDFIPTDGTTIPVADNTFDVIVSFQVIEHIVDYGIFIGEIKRVLAPGGVVLMTTPNSKVRLDTGMPPWYPFHVREFSSDELHTLLSMYFTCVSVAGLFAEKTIYTIEINRLNRMREKSRRKNQSHTSVQGVLRNWGARLIPGHFLYNIKHVFHDIQHGLFKTDSPFTIDPDFIDRYSTGDLYYSAANLESALDLLVVASDDQSAQEDVVQCIIR